MLRKDQPEVLRLRANRTQLIVLVLFVILGFAIAVVNSGTSGAAHLTTARPDELIQILDNLENDQVRLQAEQRRLQAALTAINSGSSAEVVKETQKRADSLSILAGTVPVRGPGIEIMIDDEEGNVSATAVLDAVQELRDAGAEAIEVNGRRVVVNTWFGNDPEVAGVIVSGDLRRPPYRIIAIGDADTMATAMEIPGGVADTVRTASAHIATTKLRSVTIKSTVPLIPPQYAQPEKRK
jgi:uncharacterized protein YlxW (UPF0749 family)